MKKRTILGLTLFVLICLSFHGHVKVEADNWSYFDVKPISFEGPLESYYFDNMVINIPSSLEVSYGFITFRLPDDRTITMTEHEYSDPDATEKEFKGIYQEVLREDYIKRKGDDGQVFTSELTDIYPEGKSFLISSISSDTRNSVEYYFFKFEMLVKQPTGVLRFKTSIKSEAKTFDVNDDISVFQQSRQYEFHEWLKTFMTKYKWVGKSRVIVGQNCRTEFGLIDMKDFQSRPGLMLHIWDKGAFSKMITIYTGFLFFGSNDRTINLNEFFEYSLSKPITLKLRSIAGRKGLELIKGPPGSSSGRLVWLEFLDSIRPGQTPLTVTGLAFFLNKKQDDMLILWNNVLDHIQMAP